MQHDGGLSALPPFFVRQADDGDILDPGMRTDHRLDLGGIDALATRNDHVTLAIDQVDVAFVVPADHIAD
jgi:hypothetical protein